MNAEQILDLNDIEINLVDGGIIPAVLVWAVIEGAAYGFATYAAIQAIANA